MPFACHLHHVALLWHFIVMLRLLIRHSVVVVYAIRDVLYAWNPHWENTVCQVSAAGKLQPKEIISEIPKIVLVLLAKQIAMFPGVRSFFVLFTIEGIALEFAFYFVIKIINLDEGKLKSLLYYYFFAFLQESLLYFWWDSFWDNNSLHDKWLILWNFDKTI